MTYAIQENDDPDFDKEIPYEDNIVNAVAMNGESYKNDARLAPQIILRNISEESNAHTCIKPLLRYCDDRKDFLALKERCGSEASKQAIINAAKQTLETLRYKSERSFTFERFSSKLQKTYDELADCGREVNNGDAVDALWEKMQSQDVQVHAASLRVDYQRNPCDYKLILQDIASEVATAKRVTFAAGARGASVAHTFKGPCPDNGVHASDGSLYIGSCDLSK